MSAVDSESSKIYFIADIGTTTIKASLWADAAVDAPIATLSEKNAQTVFGRDVISRVLYAHYNGVPLLQRKVLEQLSNMLVKLCESSGVMPEKLAGAVFTGNTVMLHLVRGLSVQGFEMAPFTPVTLDAAELTWGSLFKDDVLPADLPVFFPPCIDAFLGADAVCATLYAIDAVGGTNGAEPAYPLLLADVGTNTEIVLVQAASDGEDPQNWKIVCCSTAAGPAFEGGVLEGRYTGSQLVHMLAVLLKAGLMDETGLLAGVGTSSESGLTSSEKQVFSGMTQDAVRQLQLAKGAVSAAIETLLHEEKLGADEIVTFLLCGNFGSALDAEEGAEIGLFPAKLASAASYAGNAAERGARLLCSGEMRMMAKKIAASGKLIQLADNRFFARRYIECMNFGV